MKYYVALRINSGVWRVLAQRHATEQEGRRELNRLLRDVPHVTHAALCLRGDDGALSVVEAHGLHTSNSTLPPLSRRTVTT